MCVGGAGIGTEIMVVVSCNVNAEKLNLGPLQEQRVLAPNHCAVSPA